MRQIAIFIAVGTAAAFSHLSTVALLVETLGWQPLAANLAGFCLAFLVSFNGHARWTFPIAQQHYAAARSRFFVTALTGFIVNQTAYAVSLHFFGALYYLSLLATVIVCVAALTFLLSKFWAFSQSSPDAC